MPVIAPPTPADFAAARKRIERAQRILLLTHIGPDSDAIGSLLAMAHLLRAVGKDVVAACADPAPEYTRFLPGIETVTANPSGTFDMVISLDAADLGRLGALGNRFSSQIQIVFDHHITNPGFGAINLIEPEAASTAELVAAHLDDLGLTLNTPAAECLLSGIVGDTLGFRTSSTTPTTLGIAQALVAAGANLSRTIDLSLHTRSFTAIKLWGEGLTRLQLKDGLAWSVLPMAARKAAGYTGSGDADLINLLSTVREARIAVIMTERQDGRVKISWRSRPGINVGALAAAFGGGGHAQAAGAEVEGPLEIAEQRILVATRQLLNQTGEG